MRGLVGWVGGGSSRTVLDSCPWGVLVTEQGIPFGYRTGRCAAVPVPNGGATGGSRGATSGSAGFAGEGCADAGVGEQSVDDVDDGGAVVVAELVEVGEAFTE